MTKIMKTIHDLATNKVIDREMTNDEYKVYNEMLAQDETALQAKSDFEAAKAALLTKLGITAEEARILLGGN